MALNWYFDKDHVGFCEYKDRNNKIWTLDLYTGNALLIFVYRYRENDQDFYQLHNFFADKEHAKNCMGFTKGHEAIFDKNDYVFYFFKNDKKVLDIIPVLIKFGFAVQYDEILIEYSKINDQEKGVKCYEI